MDDQKEREARAHALSLLKKKLKASSRQRPQRTHEDPGNQSGVVEVNEMPKDEEEAVGTPLESQLPQIQATASRELSSDPDGAISKPLRQPAEMSTPPHPPKPLKKLVVKWSCTQCQRECIPVREESRCLCGHRYKEHPASKDDPRVVKNKALASVFTPFACTSAKCACKAFFYVVAEGAWILRCRCKHKHTDHDASATPFKCQKTKCACDGFDSPWVCNCDHPWSDHVQETIEKEFKPLELFQEQFQVDELNRVARTDLLAEPLRL